jgi:hypothetical protein
MVERGYGSGIQFNLVQEQELLALVQAGEKLLNAYIFAVAEDGADVDTELFNLERINRKDGFEVFTPTISFEHSSDLFHQNYLTRKTVLAVPPKAAPQIPQATAKPPAISAVIAKTTAPPAKTV